MVKESRTHVFYKYLSLSSLPPFRAIAEDKYLFLITGCESFVMIHIHSYYNDYIMILK